MWIVFEMSSIVEVLAVDLIKKVIDNCFDNNLAVEGVTCFSNIKCNIPEIGEFEKSVTSSLVAGISSTRVAVACAVGNIHLEKAFL